MVNIITNGNALSSINLRMAPEAHPRNLGSGLYLLIVGITSLPFHFGVEPCYLNARATREDYTPRLGFADPPLSKRGLLQLKRGQVFLNAYLVFRISYFMGDCFILWPLNFRLFFITLPLRLLRLHSPRLYSGQAGQASHRGRGNISIIHPHKGERRHV